MDGRQSRFLRGCRRDAWSGCRIRCRKRNGRALRCMRDECQPSWETFLLKPYFTGEWRLRAISCRRLEANPSETIQPLGEAGGANHPVLASRSFAPTVRPGAAGPRSALGLIKKESPRWLARV